MTNYSELQPTDSLPINEFRGQIIGAVEHNQATVITAETGAGKSTQVPQILAEAGYDVVVTQPRVLAARTLAERVKEEVDDSITVGYHTAREHFGPSDAQITFCTDGLQVVRSLTEDPTESQRERILILDEVHEWNTNIEVLLAWAKKESVKVVTMSATLESEALSEYFGNSTPVIEVPGRTFEVTKREGEDLVAETMKLATEGKNTLVFLPGKKEIEEVAQQLKASGVQNSIIPLHGQLTSEEQRQAFAKHPAGKIILATNVAQTSITIDDIDAVVDSGLERRTEERAGVESLIMAPISQADCLQRAGRAGRTKSGEYVLARLGGHPMVPFEDRKAYPTPEIMRTRLDRTMLRLAASNFNMEEMSFFHQPNKDDIRQARLRLQTLGALTVDSELTEVGREMNRLPLETHLARMIVEARRYPKRIQDVLVDCIAIQQAGGIVKNGKYNTAWKQLTQENDSDYLAQRDILNALKNIDKQDWRTFDVLTKNVFAAKENAKFITRGLGLKNNQKTETPTTLSPQDREQVLKSIASGLIDQVWFRDGYRGYTSALNHSSRELSSSSVCTSSILVAAPFDLEIQQRNGRSKTLHLLQAASRVDPSWLAEIAPQLIRLSEKGRITFNDTGKAHDRRQLMFGNLPIGEEEIVPDFQQLHEHLARLLINAHHPLQRQYQHWQKELSELSSWASTFDTQFANNLSSRLQHVLLDKVSLKGTTNLHTLLANPPQITADDLFTEEDIAKVEAIMLQHPEFIFSPSISVPIKYNKDYTGNLHATASLDWQIATELDLSDLPSIPLQFTVLMPDNSTQVFSKIEHAISRINEMKQYSAKQEYERILIESGQYLVNFGGRVRLGTGSHNQGFWVVSPDGTLRDPDNNDSDCRWNVLYPEEVALTYNSEVRDPNVGTFCVAVLPEKISENQIYAIRQLEKQYNFIEGAWQIGDEEAERRENEFMEDIFLLDEPWLEDELGRIDRPYLKLRSKTGLIIDSNLIVNDYVHRSYETNEEPLFADGREATMVEEYRIDSEQVVVLLSYEKYGTINFALKLIDKPEVREKQDNTTDREEDLSQMLENLANQYKKH